MASSAYGGGVRLETESVKTASDPYKVCESFDLLISKKLRLIIYAKRVTAQCFIDDKHPLEFTVQRLKVR